MKYIIIIDECEFSKFDVSDNRDSIAMTDKNGITWNIGIKPVIRPTLVVDNGESIYLSDDDIEQIRKYEVERITKETIERFNQNFYDTLKTELPIHTSMQDAPKPDMSKATRYHDTSIDALIDEALDELSEIKHQASETADKLSDELLRGGASNE